MVNVHTVAGWFESTMTNDDDVNEKLLDALVYAPLGLALEAKDLLPKLAERGRGQVALTRLAGTVAARRGHGARAALVRLCSAAAEVTAARAFAEKLTKLLPCPALWKLIRGRSS